MYLWNTMTQTSNQVLENAWSVLQSLTDCRNNSIIEALRENGMMRLLDLSLQLAIDAEEIEDRLCSLMGVRLVYHKKCNDGEVFYCLNHHRLLRIYALAHKLGKTNADVPSSHEQ
ncbi:MAG: hypothetical protein HUU34_17650 [Saprospiraceae bacterium]|nr:hypothetical protein [Saprospiraceae bacterium]